MQIIRFTQRKEIYSLSADVYITISVRQRKIPKFQTAKVKIKGVLCVPRGCKREFETLGIGPAPAIEPAMPI